MKTMEQKAKEWKQENREELTDFENAMMHIGGSFFGGNAGLDPNDTDTIKEQAELLLELAPKTEWSEEDEIKIKSIIAFLKSPSLCAMDGNKDIIDANIKYLKSIKDRVQPQPKQEWGEEDERIYQSIIDDTVQENQLNNEQINWLNLLKQRYTWKPSDLPHWQKSNLPNNNTTGFNSDYFCHKGYYINYKELFEKLPKDD